VLTVWLSREMDNGNSEFGRDISKVWPRIVPPRNQNEVILNNSSFRLCLEQHKQVGKKEQKKESLLKNVLP
jgi:hypothetical protein